MSEVDAALDRYLDGAGAPNVALMQILARSRSGDAARELIASRLARTREPAARARLLALADLAARHPDAWRTIQAVLAEADHGQAGGPDHWAGIFDRLARQAPEAGVALYGLGSPDLLDAATNEVVSRLRSWGLLGPDRDVLEIGCGYGRLGLALAGEVRSVLGLDVSSAMIAEAKRRAGGRPDVRFARGNGRDLREVPPGSADLVLAGDVFPYLVMAGDGLAAAHVRDSARILRSGGALAILNFSYRGDDQGDQAEVEAAFATAGLALERRGERCLALWDAAVFLGRKP